MTDTRVNDLMRRVAKLESLSRIPYVKGTFTPTYEGATTAGVTTYTTQSGHWWRVGALVFVRAELIWTAATGTGNVVLGGLPYAAAQTTPFAVMTNNVTFANSGVQGLITATEQVGRLFSPVSNGVSAQLTIEASGTLRYAIVYPVA
jgi:hypothetical protein